MSLRTRPGYRDLGAVTANRPDQNCIPGAWVNFNGTGTVAITKSFNVSSITDNGVGDWTMNFGVAFPDANYSPAGWLQDGTASNSFIWGTTTAPSASAYRMLVGATGTADYSRVSYIFFGRGV